MGRLMLSYLNRADAATLSGGAWATDLPRSNLQQDRLSKLARTFDATLASTKFDVDLGATPVPVRIVALMRHNLTQDATYRITAGASPGATTLDTGWLAAWPAIYGLLDREFEHPDWYSGRLSTAEITEYQATAPVKLRYITPTTVLHRYWRIEINDTANPVGAVLLGRLWIGPAWQPTINFDFGPAFQWQSRDRAVEARSGARFTEELPAKRVWRCTLHELTDQEAWGRISEIMRSVKSEAEILVMPDPDDLANAHRRDLFARVASWGDGIVDAAYGKQMVSPTFEERL